MSLLENDRWMEDKRERLDELVELLNYDFFEQKIYPDLKAARAAAREIIEIIDKIENEGYEL